MSKRVKQNIELQEKGHAIIYITNIYRPYTGGSVVKNLPCQARDAGSILRLGRSLEEGNSNSLEYSCLENPMDKGPWWTAVHWVIKELDMTSANKPRINQEVC